MNIFDRVKELLINPRITWETIKGEEIEIKTFFINYAAPLALIPTICGLIGISLLDVRFPAGNVARAPFFQALIGGILGYVVNLAAVYAGAWAVKFLAPMFNAKSDLKEAVKVVGYSMTPAWLVGFFSLVPGLSILSILALYSIYLLSLGVQIILETPADKVIWFTLSILLSGIIISFISSIIMINLVYGPMFVRMMAL
ncbi:YIP1 family protein [Candidatus Saganbacteria bacterium]|nr:YIP1 family protein [Candidatus Saganbacteria bacterium]